MNALLVDDEPLMIHALQKYIDWKDLGISCVFQADDMQSAIQIMREKPVHLMLCDIEMPQGTGLELFEYVKQYYPAVECIFVTCYDTYGYIRRAFQLGSFDYLLKPVDYADLRRVIEEALRRLSAGIEKQAPPDSPDLPADEEISYIQQIKAYIERRLTQHIAITDIADTVHLNCQYIMRMFKSEMSITILQYMTERRIVKACELLRTTDYSIASVAEAVGIYNKSYFAKLFKFYQGMTPSEFRKQADYGRANSH